jgi:copper chaperone CopZ
MTTYTVAVEGMTCDGCERIVEREASAVEGVRDVDADADADRVVVTGSRDTIGPVCTTIRALGYDVVS